MLRIVWQGPRVSQILCYIGHTYRLQAMCFLLMRTIVQCSMYNVGKDRQHTRALEIQLSGQCRIQIMQMHTSKRGMCPESSSMSSRRSTILETSVCCHWSCLHVYRCKWKQSMRENFNPRPLSSKPRPFACVVRSCFSYSLVQIEQFCQGKPEY